MTKNESNGYYNCFYICFGQSDLIILECEKIKRHKNNELRIFIDRYYCLKGVMCVEVYLDVLLMENIVINYLILYVTARLSRNRASSIRLFLSSSIGAFYVLLLVFFPHVKVYYTVSGKVLLSFAMIVAAFSPEKISGFLKTLAIFYVSTFIFAGAAFAFMYFNESGSMVKNGIVYVFWQSKWTQLLLSIIMVFIILKILWEIIQSKVIGDKLLLPLKIIFESKLTVIEALVDTGNTLCDPLTKNPVIVVEYKAIREILPEEIRVIFDESRENDLAVVTRIVSDSAWFSRFRLIPFSSIGKDNGMLIGFKPDSIEIGEESEKKEVSDVIICIYNRSLSRNNRYKALLSPELAPGIQN